MKISNMQQRLTLLKKSDQNGGLTFDKYQEIIDVVGIVNPINSKKNLFEIIFQKPNARFQNTPISAIKHNNNIFEPIDSLKIFQNSYIKGIFKTSA